MVAIVQRGILTLITLLPSVVRAQEADPRPLDGGASPATAPVVIRAIAPGTTFARHPIGDAASTSASERLIYSTTLGSFAVALPANYVVADEISTVAARGCRLRRVEFPIVGKVDPEDVGGPFSVEFALFSTCPGSISAELRPGFIIPGSLVRLDFSDDAPRLVSFALPGDGPAIPNTVWFAVKFNRANVGMVMGGPASTGFSCDLIDFPGFPCNAWLGGFPEHPWANFNLELFGDASCGSSFVGYKNSRISGPTFNPGVGVTLTDDIKLGVESCRMTGYEVAVRGVGDYDFDVRPACAAPPIEGTQRSFNVPSGTEPRIARFAIDPPIAIPRDFHFAAWVNNPNSGVVLSGRQACVGETLDEFEIPSELGGCSDLSAPWPGVHAAVNLTILCEGQPPIGACCDMYFTDPEGESVCREVAQMNCAFPPQFSFLRPRWVEGAVCDPDPFPGSDCGKAACCKPDDTCENLTQNECNAVLPLDRARQWLRGLICSVEGQSCPFNACLGRSGECSLPRNCPIPLCGLPCYQTGVSCPPTGCDECPPIGCEDPNCCTCVCSRDFFCCDTEWDVACASLALQGCCDDPHVPDECAPGRFSEGATWISVPGVAENGSFRATIGPHDLGFSCYLGDPLNLGTQSVWYKFIAPPAVAPNMRSNVVFSTCNSNSPADDSLLQLFSVCDPTDPFTQCATLVPQGCSDDVTGCGRNGMGTNSRLCARDLIPGQIYYVMLAAKVAETSPTAKYRLDTAQVLNCPGLPNPPDDINDFCPRAIPLSDGPTPFDMGRTNPPYTPDWAEPCIPSMTKDAWYKYTPTCTGKLTIDTCTGDAQTAPDTTLAVYPGSCCPVRGGAALACNSDDLGLACGLASRVTLDVVLDQPLIIRVGDSSGNAPAGMLNVSCAPATCPVGYLAIVQPPEAGGIPDGVLDARRPHSSESATPLEGIQTLKVRTTRDAQASCFTLCESAIPPAPNATDNLIQSVVEAPPGTYTITLARPITPGAKTRITYEPDDPAVNPSHVYLYSHPGNVNDDDTVNEADVLAMRDALGGAILLPWGLYSSDLNRSFVNAPLKSSGITPADLLEAIDLLNGTGAFPAYGATTTPRYSPACP